MNPGSTGIIFAGQGRLVPAPFTTGPLAARFAAVAGELTSSAEAASRLRGAPRATPERLALFVFAASIAHYRELLDHRVPPAVLVGHGFGEIAALVCGGALRPRQGAEVVVRRLAALERWCGRAGAMAVVHAACPAVERLIREAGHDSVAVAADNAPQQVVISGSGDGVAAVVLQARSRGLAVTRLSARWPLHSPGAMAGVAADLRWQLRGLRADALHTPVFSPTLGRYCRATDDVVELLAAQVTKPVRFADAVRYLSTVKHITAFRVCGPLRGLTGCVRAIVAARRGVGPRADDPPMALAG